MLQPARGEKPLDFFHVIQGVQGNVVERWRMSLLAQYVRKRWDQLKRHASSVTHLHERLQDFREVHVAEAWGEAVGVREVHVIQEVSEGADGRWDRSFFDIHVNGIGHDTAAREARLPPHPRALVESVQHEGAVAVPALQREADPEGSRVLAGCPYSLYRPQPFVMRIGDGLDARVRRRGDDEERGFELCGELGDLAQVNPCSVSNVSFGMGQIAFRGANQPPR